MTRIQHHLDGAIGVKVDVTDNKGVIRTGVLQSVDYERGSAVLTRTGEIMLVLNVLSIRAARLPKGAPIPGAPRATC